jgi:crotonobetainyl-CoA:carnitine CoA-transferase CaiB-like acyl-CoA transferase
MCDAATGMFSVIGVLQALRERDRTGLPQQVAADILSAAMFLSSDGFVGPDGLATRPHLDREQTGLAPLYRLYATADGWLCVAAVRDEHWRALCTAIGRPELADDADFATPPARDEHATALSDVLGEVFSTKPAAEWCAILDDHDVPCEVSSETWRDTWYDDAEVVAKEWVTDYRHAVWGRLNHPGRLIDLSGTPTRLAGPPPVIGAHTREVLAELGYDDAEITSLRSGGAVRW